MIRLDYRWGLAWPSLCLGWEASFQGRLADARQLLTSSVAISDEIALPITSGLASGFLTYVHLACGNTELAYSLASTTLKRVNETGAGLIAGMAHQMLGATLMARGELVAARDHLQAAVDAERRTGFTYALSWHLALLGSLERVEGELDTTQACGEEALEVARRLGSGWLQSGAERLLGRGALAAGAATDAERYVHHALGRLAGKGVVDIPECLDVLGAVAATQENHEEAARLLGAAAARARFGVVRFPPSRSSGLASSGPPEKRSETTATTPPLPQAQRCAQMRRLATSAGPAASGNDRPAAGTA
ncbi:MAG: hypothetical protein ACJ8H8_00685 [Geminicoccaceae bacterium]